MLAMARPMGIRKTRILNRRTPRAKRSASKPGAAAAITHGAATAKPAAARIASPTLRIR